MAKLSVFTGMKTSGAATQHNGKHPAESASADPDSLLREDVFRQMLARERKRSERSRKHLLLMLIDEKGSVPAKDENAFLLQVANRLAEMTRETDLAGWFEADSVFGMIFTELGQTDIKAAMSVIQTKITTCLQKSFKPSQLNKVFISFYAFPDGWESNGNGESRPISPSLYPDLFEAKERKKLSLIIKRAMDITGSTVALILSSPFFLGLSILIKLTSKGPVFYKQERIGQYGAPFQFIKFRSMKVSNDAKIHKDYVKNFIAGKAEPAASAANGDTAPVYKITNDPRVTWIGRIMRRTSLDELPQFWNTLKGEMSLVGPRPPIAYELEAYDVWHRRRLLEVKPGITGLWQVHGRSKTTFNEMVRLDLQYSRTWSPLMDARILLQTPRAVISGDGAY